MTDQALPAEGGAPQADYGIVSETGAEIHDRMMAEINPPEPEPTEPPEGAQPEEPAMASESPAEEKEEKVSAGVQRRIDELTWKYHEAERQRQAERAEFLALMQRAQIQPQEQAPAVDPNAPPDPANFAGGAYDPAYLEARADWAGQQATARMLAQYQQQQEMQRKAADLNAREMEFAQAVPDYQQAIGTAVPVLRQMSPVVTQALMESDVGPQMAYTLAKAPEALRELATLPPAVAVKKIGALEDRILGMLRKPAAQEPAAPATPPPPPQKVATPEPWKGNGGGGASSALERAEKVYETTGDATELHRVRAKLKAKK